jgi:homoserine kinase type II
MSLLTSMTSVQARRIGASFGLSVAAVRALAEGVNSNFVFELEDGGSVFARVHEWVSSEAVEAQCRLLDHLAAAGVPTPPPLRRCDGGGKVADHANKPVALFPFFPGDHCDQPSVTAARARRVGEAVAQIHRAGESFVDPLPGAVGVAELQHQVTELARRQLAPPLHRDLAFLADRLAALALTGTLSGPTIPVIHGDLFRDNVLWIGEELTGVLDFELAAAGSPVFDLMVTVLAWCFGEALDPSLAQALVAGYLRVRPLSDRERDSCYVQGRLAALCFAVTRIVDYELRPPGVIAYKDYRRFLARLDAIEQIGAEHFRSWLFDHR